MPAMSQRRLHYDDDEEAVQQKEQSLNAVASQTEPISPVSRSKSSSALARAFAGLFVSRQRNETTEDIRGPLGLGDPLSIPDQEPVADIIFIHGLGGGSRKTWSYGPEQSLFWPKEWLQRDSEFKDVRIHSFGYDSDWVERRSSPLDITTLAGV